VLACGPSLTARPEREDNTTYDDNGSLCGGLSVRMKITTLGGRIIGDLGGYQKSKNIDLKYSSRSFKYAI
jgi:hypothetical protein